MLNDAEIVGKICISIGWGPVIEQQDGKNYLGKRNITCKDRIVEEHGVVSRKQEYIGLAGVELEIIWKGTYSLGHFIILCLEFFAIMLYNSLLRI